ncbi:MAG: hypothetical protein WCI67_13000 [Chloroflexales bacterium]
MKLDHMFIPVGAALQLTAVDIAPDGVVADLQTTYDPAFGLARAKLARSREARLALFLMRYRQIAGQPWRLVDETLLRDDGAQPAPNPAQLRLAA